MTDLSVAHRAALAQLVDHCPDALLARLSGAVAGMASERGRAVAAMFAEAGRDRGRRNRVMAPLLPMFAPRADGVEALTFPAEVLPRLWRIAADREPQLLPALDADGGWAAVADRICQAGAAAARDRADEIWPPGLQPEARQAGLDELAGCLDLAHLARRGMAGLPAWIGRPDGDQLAELRLLIRDATTVAPDGARRMIDILFAHLGEAALILRVITQSSGAAGREGFLGESEMAGFVDRLIEGVRSRAIRIEAFRPVEGEPAALQLAADVAWSAAVLTELDVTLALQPDGPWGRGVREARVRLARQLAGVLKSAEKAVEAALPMTRMQLAGRMTRMAPRLDAPADGDAMTGALTLAALVGTLRGAAAVFGCESERRGLVERMIERLTAYADEALTLINGGEAADEANAVALLERAAELLARLDATEAARTVRRRAAVAGPQQPGQAAVA